LLWKIKMEKDMLRKIFKHLLKRYSKTEKDRLEILEELWNGILYTYNEQTYPGNVSNMQIEFFMSNPYVRYASASFDSETLDAIKTITSNAVDESIDFLQKENPRIDKSGFDLLIKFHSIKNGKN